MQNTWNLFSLNLVNPELVLKFFVFIEPMNSHNTNFLSFDFLCRVHWAKWHVYKVFLNKQLNQIYFHGYKEMYLAQSLILWWIVGLKRASI